jgi:hypothetical protein
MTSNLYRDVANGRVTLEQGMRQLTAQREADELERDRRSRLGWLAAFLLGGILLLAGRVFASPQATVTADPTIIVAGAHAMVDAGPVTTLPAADVPDDLAPRDVADVDGNGDVKLHDDGSQLALLALQFAAAGMWGPFAAVILALLIWAARKWGKVLFPQAAVFFDQPAVAALLPTVGAVLIDIALALKAGTPLSVQLIIRSVGLGLMANGAFNVAMKLREQRATMAGNAAAATVTDRKNAADALNQK